MSGLGRGLQSLIPSRKVLPNEVYRAASAPSSSLGFSSPSESRAGTPLQAPIDKVKPNPRQPREHFSHTAIEELIASIKEYGVLQPLVVTANPDGTYELIAGERRLRAAKLAGLATVPVIIRTANEQQKLELALIENLQRQDLSPIEEAKAFKILLEEYDLTQEEVAGKMGKSRGYVANTVRLLNLPEEAQEAVSKGYLTASNARTLAGLESAAEQKKWLQKMMKEGMTAREAEQVVTKRKRAVLRDPQAAADEETLRESLGTKVRIAKKEGKGNITIDFYSDEEYRTLVKKLTY